MALPAPRRRFQFRLQTLLLIATIVSVECAVCLPMLREWQDLGRKGEETDRAVQLAIDWLKKHPRSDSRWQYVPIPEEIVPPLMEISHPTAAEPQRLDRPPDAKRTSVSNESSHRP